MSSPVGMRVPGMFGVTVCYVIKLFPSLGTPDQILPAMLARSSLLGLQALWPGGPSQLSRVLW